MKKARNKIVLAVILLASLAAGGEYYIKTIPSFHTDKSPQETSDQPGKPANSKPKLAEEPTLIKFTSQQAAEEYEAKHQIELIKVPLGYYKTRTPKSQLPPDQAIVSVSDNLQYRALVIPNDSLYSQQYAPPITSAPQGWDVSTGSASTVIAVIDTGFGLNHDDIKNKWWSNPNETGITVLEGGAPNCTSRGLPLDKSCNNRDDDGNSLTDDWRGWDYVGNGTTGDNDVSAGTTEPLNQYAAHGTMTAGLAGAQTNNGTGIAGTCWLCKVMPVQVLGDNGVGETAEVAAGIRYAADNNAHVISLSLGADGFDPLLQSAVEYAQSKNIIVVAAAGNSGPGNMIYPALYPGVISVGATDSNDNLASFSSTGPQLAISAPGVSVRTTWWQATNGTSSYAYASGTSMSTPQAAGLAALIKTQYPSSTPTEITRWIKNGADKVAGMKGAVRTDQYGHGRINLHHSLTNYSWSFSSQASYTDSSLTTPIDLANMGAGQTVWLVVRATNTGNITWQKTGPNPVRIGGAPPLERRSRFATGAWITPSRPATMEEASVAPGQIATFKFPITIPNGNGTFSEYFNLLAEHYMWLNEDVGQHFVITVKDSYTWSWNSQAAYTDSSKTTSVDLSNMSPGQTAWLQVRANNTGNATWLKTGNYPLRIGTAHPLERHSRFATGAWITPSRPGTMLEASVAPGGVATFEFPITVPAGGGTYREYFNPLAESLTWLNEDVGQFFPITVK
ncbi:MAG TPA: S8 family serine peptidase [Candidatus Dormibacteraeota bacterium]|nr:S8 family serine peptidase [Candidatus Dormibacteraeota bacterium]